MAVRSRWRPVSPETPPLSQTAHVSRESRAAGDGRRHTETQRRHVPAEGCVTGPLLWDRWHGPSDANSPRPTSRRATPAAQLRRDRPSTDRLRGLALHIHDTGETGQTRTTARSDAGAHYRPGDNAVGGRGPAIQSQSLGPQTPGCSITATDDMRRAAT